MLSFWWIRHAPVVGNNFCCYGNNEVDCDVSNVQLFQELKDKLPNNSHVYTSNLSRTIKTFKAVANLGYKYESHRIDNRLSEQDLGDYTGMKYNDLYKLTKKLGVYDRNWLMKADYSPPNGESFNNLCQRVKSFINETILNHKDGNVIIFSHGGPIRAAISLAINYKLNYVLPIEIDNNKLTIINCYGKGNYKVLKANS